VVDVGEVEGDVELKAGGDEGVEEGCGVEAAAPGEEDGAGLVWGELVEDDADEIGHGLAGSAC
jgi:hypothetical protein